MKEQIQVWLAYLSSMRTESLNEVLILGTVVTILLAMGMFTLLKLTIRKYRAKGNTVTMSRQARRFVHEMFREMEDELVKIMSDPKWKGKVPNKEIFRLYNALGRSLGLWDLLPKHLPERTPSPEELKAAIRGRVKGFIAKSHVEGNDEFLEQFFVPDRITL